MAVLELLWSAERAGEDKRIAYWIESSHTRAVHTKDRLEVRLRVIVLTAEGSV